MNETRFRIPMWAVIVDSLGSLILVLGLFCYTSDTELLPGLGKNNLTLGVTGFGGFLMMLGLSDLVLTLVKRNQPSDN